MGGNGSLPELRLARPLHRRRRKNDETRVTERERAGANIKTATGIETFSLCRGLSLTLS
jgi:hypothetical protein